MGVRVGVGWELGLASGGGGLLDLAFWRWAVAVAAAEEAPSALSHYLQQAAPATSAVHNSPMKHSLVDPVVPRIENATTKIAETGLNCWREGP